MHPVKEQLPITERAALRLDFAADYSGLGKTTLYSLINRKKLDSIKVGGRRLVLRASLDALLSESAIK